MTNQNSVIVKNLEPKLSLAILITLNSHIFLTFILYLRFF